MLFDTALIFLGLAVLLLVLEQFYSRLSAGRVHSTVDLLIIGFQKVRRAFVAQQIASSIDLPSRIAPPKRERNQTMTDGSIIDIQAFERNAITALNPVKTTRSPGQKGCIVVELVLFLVPLLATLCVFISGCARWDWRSLLADGYSCAGEAVPVVVAVADQLLADVNLEQRSGRDFNVTSWRPHVTRLATRIGTCLLERGSAHLLEDLSHQTEAQIHTMPSESAKTRIPASICHTVTPKMKPYLQTILTAHR